jgi:hypothetical protein
MNARVDRLIPKRAAAHVPEPRRQQCDHTSWDIIVARNREFARAMRIAAESPVQELGRLLGIVGKETAIGRRYHRVIFAQREIERAVHGAWMLDD